uniref:Uncharacterized protein n=1 Tax=Ascaris lumbricoides TaxID=6252 RepID=A0A0M3I1Z1_ASCLU
MDAEEVDDCPTCLWYFVATFGCTILILVLLIAYLTMYSTHFTWVLKKRKKQWVRRPARRLRLAQRAWRAGEVVKTRKGRKTRKTMIQLEKHAASPTR